MSIGLVCSVMGQARKKDDKQLLNCGICETGNDLSHGHRYTGVALGSGTVQPEAGEERGDSAQ